MSNNNFFDPGGVVFNYILVQFSVDKYNLEDDITQIDAKILRRYTVWLKRAGYSPTTIKRRLDSFGSFFHYLVNEEILTTNPMARVDLPKVHKKIPKFLTQEELDLLLYVADNDTSIFQKRNSALLRVLAFMGLRRSELIKLNWSDVDFKNASITIYNGKGSKDRVVPMNEDVQEHLWVYLQSRLPLTNQAVFTNRIGNRVNADTLRRVLNNHTTKAAIKKITPHWLRHTCATLLIKNKVDIVTMKEVLGHSDINSTLIYTHTTPERLLDAVNTLGRK
ncbi:tyrosine-type recombinase/integrase [Peptococcaceae bacterium 1198_IL3148]